MTEIIPAIIPESYDHLRSKLLLVKGLTKTIQIDITDGLFVVSRSWPMKKSDQRLFNEIVKGNEGLPYWEDFSFEIDLMTHKPEMYLEDWIRAGVERIIFHIESRHDFGEIKRIAKGNVELGVAIQNKTPIERLDSYIEAIDYVQVMGITTLGQQGEPFSADTLTTIRSIKAKYPSVTIQIDGGVNDMSAPQLIAAGADRLVSGSFILRSSDPRRAIEILSHGQTSH